MEGKKVNFVLVLKVGIIDEVVDILDELISWVKVFIDVNFLCQQFWDQKGFKLLGGGFQYLVMVQKLVIVLVMLKQKIKGCYLVLECILFVVVEGVQVYFDVGSQIEICYFVELVIGQVVKNMIGIFWFQFNVIKVGGSCFGGVVKEIFKKVGVFGVGMMGVGIVYFIVICGIEVVLKDVLVENVEKGKSYLEKLLVKKVSCGWMIEVQKDEIFGCIMVIDSVDDLDGCDLVIEVVFEDSDLKVRVIQEVEFKLWVNGIFVLNIFIILIIQLVEVLSVLEYFIGLYFFLLVDKMQLVEIIVGKVILDEILVWVFDYVQQIGKVFIVVNDSCGFFIFWVFGIFVNEGIFMFGEGIYLVSIENVGVFVGMLVGFLVIFDEVSLILM